VQEGFVAKTERRSFLASVTMSGNKKKKLKKKQSDIFSIAIKILALLLFWQRKYYL